ncbi:hypothetical protein DPMN_177619 [Dreissena polymorpha]|uniref:Uncharacterized protein n=1 Tax=Dreissena polymorpha TaxID=45954 RepID=A0A9D4EBG3_DREPO|nr:hypothetical protein DPMN_177619 [Dreissena polymorpha]
MSRPKKKRNSELSEYEDDDSDIAPKKEKSKFSGSEEKEEEKEDLRNNVRVYCYTFCTVYLLS